MTIFIELFISILHKKGIIQNNTKETYLTISLRKFIISLSKIKKIPLNKEL